MVATILTQIFKFPIDYLKSRHRTTSVCQKEFPTLMRCPKAKPEQLIRYLKLSVIYESLVAYSQVMTFQTCNARFEHFSGTTTF